MLRLTHLLPGDPASFSLAISASPPKFPNHGIDMLAKPSRELEARHREDRDRLDNRFDEDILPPWEMPSY
jgi:hypothetical protein